MKLVPPFVARRFFAVGGGGQGQRQTREAEKEEMIAEVEKILDLFEDSYMNRHLIFRILELVFVRILPELGEQGVGELMEARGVTL